MATSPEKILLIGASGAVGKQLARELVRRKGKGTVIAALRRTPLPADLADDVITEYGVDVCDPSSLERVIKSHAGTISCVWNLAAPLSVDTAKDPSHAWKVTVGGMNALCQLAIKYGIPKICFSDSIGSYGNEAPRHEATASWLVEHPQQDPGSDYGCAILACCVV